MKANDSYLVSLGEGCRRFGSVHILYNADGVG